MASSLPLLIALESSSDQIRIEGDRSSGFIVVHPWGREVYDAHGQARSERNAAHAALPADGRVIAQYPLRLGFEQVGKRRELDWVLKIKAPAAAAAPPAPTPAPEMPPASAAEPAPLVVRGDVRTDTASLNPDLDWSHGFIASSSRSACGVFSLMDDGRWEYAFNPASRTLAQVTPGLMLLEAFELSSRKGLRCKVTLEVSPLADVPGRWSVVPQTQLL
ncbi:VCBS domain-containing protein [Amphibiibacter pelophylacis]|uniref:VCBS domain-containing protein n=1 Tax=Amphibiibacter pelophylacis TaxID=1799477 RepID=A0ACC6P0G8_9BURK